MTGSSDQTMMQWSITGELLKIMRGHTSAVLDVRLEEESIGNAAYSCSKDFTIKKWDLHTGACVLTFSGHGAAVNAISVSGTVLASASGDNSIRLWNTGTGQLMKELLGHSRGLACIQFNGAYIVSGSNDRTIKVWDAVTGECLRTLLGHTDLVRTLSFDDKKIGILFSFPS